MLILLDRRDDGTVALYIDGDLQFDSRDERIYHEALALPALALAARRAGEPLRALICGGGDGLAARELLKSERVARIDLVDYDPTIVELARGELADLNQRSLDHLCVHVHADDAWEFCAAAQRRGQRYHLIVVDLTVPQDIAGARFHSVEWYERLRALLSDEGILAVNGVSPGGAPEAYWSIYNGMRAAGLAARPYRVALPSFRAAGYGDDWGFFVAARAPIAAAELADLALDGPRQALLDARQLRHMFVFPAAMAALRGSAPPFRAGSGVLLHELYNGAAFEDDGATWDGLGFASDDAPLPGADDGRHLLPPSLRGDLAGPIGTPLDEQRLLERVLDLMPALRRHHTRDMIAAFLADPGRFLAAVDLPALVERLLRRAAELPRALAAELRLLRARLIEFAGDQRRLLDLGMRVVTILTVVIILANLVYPDAVYGKGGDAGGAHTGDTVSLASPSRGVYDPSAEPSLATGGGFRDADGGAATVDESGSLFPTRRYRYYPTYRGYRGYHSYRSGQPASSPAAEETSAFRLTPEADITNEGQVAIALNETAYLLIDSELAMVVDQQSGEPLIYLERDAAQVWRIAKEIERQRRGLEQTARAKQVWVNWVDWLDFAPWTEGDRRELANVQAMAGRLQKARDSLGAVTASQPPLSQPPVAGAFELFSGVWLLPDGSGLALRTPDGLEFMDGANLYSDQQRAQVVDKTYPAQFKALIAALVGQELKDRSATLTRVQSDLSLARTDLATLERDLAEYTALQRGNSDSYEVDYGTEQIPVVEALRRTNDDLARTRQLADLLQRQLTELPMEFTAAEKLLAAWKA